MKLSELSIRRPVLATVVSLAIILFGAISFFRTPVREYPNIDPPIVSITTVYRGAASSVIEAEITEPIEEELATLEGVKILRSSSQEQASRIQVEFVLSRNVDQAANDVRDKLSRVRGRLPREADDPIVAKVDTNANAIMWLALYGEGFSNLEVSDVANVVLKERLQRMPGIGSVIVGGERKYSMRVWLDPARLAAYGLTVVDVDNAIRGQNAEIPSGRIEGEGREFSVRTRGDLADPEQFGRIFLAQRGDRPVHLADVADVRVGAEDDRTVIRYDGVPAVGLGIVKQASASTLEVADAVKASLSQLRGVVPKGMKLEVAYDSSIFIRDSISEVRLTLLVAMGLVVLVIFLFLKSPTATLIPTLAIPVSIVGAFTVVYFAGFSINILTLLALVLAIGLVVDDAIVMLENVYRHIEMGKPRRKAAFDGAAEIGFAIVATTVALVAIFVPVAFLRGNVGRLFNEFGLTVAVAVLISGFVALTLTPMLCSLALKGHESEGRLARLVQRGFDALDRLYDRSVRTALARRRLILAATAGIFVLIGFLFRVIPSELVPTEDRGVIVGILIAPEGSTLAYTDRYATQVESIYRGVPEAAGVFTGIGLTGDQGPGRVTDGFFFVNLKPFSQRRRSQQQIVQSLFPRLLSVPGVLAFPINPPSLGGQFSATPVQYVIQAPTYDDLQAAVGAVLQEASKLPYLLNLDTDLKMNTPQIELAIDRARASDLGVSVTDIGTTLQTLLGGRESTLFRRGDKQYKVLLQVRPSERATPRAIDDLYLRGNGGLFQMANVLTAKETVSPKELNHFNRVRSAKITANLVPGTTLGAALDDLDRIAKTKLPPGVRTDLDGESREFRESSGNLYFLFGIAVVFIYLVLAGQFESFVHPFTILLTVPLAVFGALVTLKLLGMSLNIYSQIGLILLIGLVTKNAILIVEYANQLREREGLDAIEAVARAARIRLRPILMTSFATIFGTLPIALGLGAGAESRKPLGVAVVGGLLFSTLLTVLVVPVVYSYLSGRRERAAEEDALSEQAASAARA